LSSNAAAARFQADRGRTLVDSGVQGGDPRRHGPVVASRPGIPEGNQGAMTGIALMTAAAVAQVCIVGAALGFAVLAPRSRPWSLVLLRSATPPAILHLVMFASFPVYLNGATFPAFARTMGLLSVKMFVPTLVCCPLGIGLSPSKRLRLAYERHLLGRFSTVGAVAFFTL
jgi:hypothetical protein